MAPTTHWPTDHSPIANTDQPNPPNSLTTHPIWPFFHLKGHYSLYKQCIFWKLMAPTTHWPTDHSPITNTDPTDPPNSLRTHQTHFRTLSSMQTIHFLKAHGTFYPLTHWPLTYHQHRPIKPNQSPPNLTLPPLPVLHCTNHFLPESSQRPLPTDQRPFAHLYPTSCMSQSYMG